MIAALLVVAANLERSAAASPVCHTVEVPPRSVEEWVCAGLSVAPGGGRRDHNVELDVMDAPARGVRIRLRTPLEQHGPFDLQQPWRRKFPVGTAGGDCEVCFRAAAAQAAAEAPGPSHVRFSFGLAQHDAAPHDAAQAVEAGAEEVLAGLSGTLLRVEQQLHAVRAQQADRLLDEDRARAAQQSNAAHTRWLAVAKLVAVLAVLVGQVTVVRQMDRA